MDRKYSFLFIVLASILWRVDELLRRNLYTLPAIIVVFYEHLIGLTFLLPFIISQLPELKKLQPRVFCLVWVVFLSGIGGTLMYVATLSRINYIQFSVVVLLQQTQPLFVLIFARIWLKEKIGYSDL